MKNIFAATVTMSVSMSAAALAGVTHEVTVGNTYYDPQWLEVQPGDQITWTRVQGTHDVISGEDCNDEDGLISSPTLNGANTTFTWTVPAGQTENIEYYCSVSSHCANGNQYGGLILGGNGVIHIVETNGFSFDPPVVTASPGDLVIFEHGGGTHTVTFGEDCVADGTLNEPLSSTNGAILWRVPAELAGATQNYFCAPHCGFGMTGSIEIIGDDDDCPSDVDGDNDIDVDDLLSLLGEFGRDCSVQDCSADVDGNGVVDVNDLLDMLGVFGEDC